MSTDPGTVPQSQKPGDPVEFLLDIVVEPDATLATVYFTAASVDAALEQGRDFLTVHRGPADRFGELYRRHGARGVYVDVVELPHQVAAGLR